MSSEHPALATPSWFQNLLCTSPKDENNLSIEAEQVACSSTMGSTNPFHYIRGAISVALKKNAGNSAASALKAMTAIFINHYNFPFLLKYMVY